MKNGPHEYEVRPLVINYDKFKSQKNVHNLKS